MIYTTTLNAIRECDPCTDGWSKLLRHLGKTKPDDEPVTLATILESNGLDDALWCLRAVNDIDRDARLFAVWCARQVQHLNPDPKVAACIDTAERFANGAATTAELADAWDAAWSAAWSAASDAQRQEFIRRFCTDGSDK